MAQTVRSGRSKDARTHILEQAQRLIAARGFVGVGLSDILASAGVPKGSFYHWFASKDAFGSDLLEFYFDNYLNELDGLLEDDRISGRQRLANYWRFWRDNQESNDLEGKCLAVKLGAEVSDISEGMRDVLKRGTSSIITKLSRAVAEGIEDGSITTAVDPIIIAETLYQLWLGASVMAKIARSAAPFEAAIAATDRMLSGQ